MQQNWGENLRTLLILALCAVLGACAARSKTTLSDSNALKFPPNTGPVCMLRSPLPSNVQYKIIAAINSSKRTYGSVSELIPLMATDAKAIGADVVMNLTTKQQMGLLAWARPVGNGTAVKLYDPESFNCVSAGGELR